MNKKELRTRQVLEMVQMHRRINVRAVADEMGISEATVRRLFTDLEQQGHVIRVHGGVQLALSSTQAYSFDQSEPERVDQKLAIARAAAEHVRNSDRVFLDSGTTVQRLAECLSLRLRDGQLEDIAVLTNSLSVAEILAESCKVILVGGEVRMSRRDVSGALSQKTLLRYRLHRSFLGADAIDIDSGYMTTDEQTASMNEIVIERSDQSFVLADSEKFRRSSFVAYAALSEIDSVITDWELDAEDMRRFQAAGAEITVVEKPTDVGFAQKNE